MEKDDKMLLARLSDKALQCRNKNILKTDFFLDCREAVLAKNLCKDLGVSLLLYGGYENAERQIPIFFPDYMDEEMAKEEAPLMLLRVQLPRGAKKLSHRDYLGSILSLGIKRELTGDILVRENGADIIILKEIGEFLNSSYEKAGRMNLETFLLPISQLKLSEIKTEDITDFVASIRLDAIVSSAFHISRGKAQEAISQGLISVNGLQCLKADFQPKEKDRISFHGKGKAVLYEIGNQSKKGRTFILIKRYI